MNLRKPAAYLTLCIFSLMLCCSCSQKDVQLVVEPTLAPPTIITMVVLADMQEITPELFRQLADNYNASQSSVFLQIEAISGSVTYSDLVQKRLENNSKDDIFVLPTNLAKPLSYSGKLYNLSGLSAAQQLLNDANGGFLTGEDLYVLPLTTTAFGMYTNLDLLHSLGLSAPRDLQSLLECCTVLKENGIQPFSLNR